MDSHFPPEFEKQAHPGQSPVGTEEGLPSEPSVGSPVPTVTIKLHRALLVEAPTVEVTSPQCGAGSQGPQELGR